MLEYLKKFNALPAEVKAKVSSKEAIAAIEALEKKYQVALAALVMKVMVKEVALGELAVYLVKENLGKIRAEELARELKEKIFSFLDAQTPAAKGASFFFSADDEAEIRELAKNIGQLAKIEEPVVPVVPVERKLEEVIRRAQINFGSVELADRFSQILKTYLRGIRNRLETKMTLVKPFLNGGLSFDHDSAEKVMVLADKAIKAKPGETMAPPPKIKLPELAAIGREAAYDFSRLKKLDTGHELPAPPKPVAPPAAAGQMPLIKRRFEAENLSQSTKARIEDVKFVPKVMGPIDEIKYLDLTAFRRLGGDPFKTAEKIKSKLALLEEESYGKRLEGIKAWRLSPIFKLYLALGGLSISANKPIDVIIEERKLAGGEYLTADEFRAIMDLNKNLRF
ncbi:MAG: hypothetical protein AUK20_01800 [Parcubacteria group bacterium CG2_30_45_37]|nr:MAG: hypothetical protein AUK20_01800 [Parcubacteria group bacterium CG2_30_45_37]